MKKILSLILLLCFMTPYASSEILKLLKDGNEIKTVPIGDKMVLYFANDKLRVFEDEDDSADPIFEMPYEAFSRMVFDLDLGGITDIKTVSSGISVYYDASIDELNVVSDNTIKEVRIYNMQGMCVHNARVSDTNKVTVSMSSLLPGVYVAAIVSDNGVFTSKIAKK